jgi:hypothetical protein
LYSTLILPNNRPAVHYTTSTCHLQSIPPTRTSSSLSGTRTQEPYVLPPTYPPQCMIINNVNPPEPMWSLTMQLQWRPHKSDIISLINNPGQMSLIDLIAIPDKAPPPHQPPPNNKQEEHCSALSLHLLSHVKNLPPQEQKLLNGVEKTSK